MKHTCKGRKIALKRNRFLLILRRVYNGHVTADWQVIVMSSIMSYESLSYSSYTLGSYSYPHWANITGWMIAVSSMVSVPVVAVYQIIRLPGRAKQVLTSITLYSLLLVVITNCYCFGIPLFEPPQVISM